ncbi:zf-CCHC domain-containing protein, partial [Tanacetum coccineum]
MDSDKYLEGQSIQRPPLFESDCFIYWKNRFETYVKAKDLDLWHIILNGDFPPVTQKKDTKVLEAVPFEEQSDDLKKKLAKNNEAKMVLYNALPKRNMKDNKIDLFVQQYEQFTILEEESIDSGFDRFNTIITSLKALDEDLSSLALDELIGNLKVHEVVMEKDFEIYRGKKERFKSIALKAKKDSSDDEILTSKSDDEEYAMAKGKSDRKCFRCGDPNHLIGDCPKPPRNKGQKAFIGGSWSDSEYDAEDKTNDETSLMAQSSNKVCLRTCLDPDEWIKDNGCSKHMLGNKTIFSTYKAYNE